MVDHAIELTAEQVLALASLALSPALVLTSEQSSERSLLMEKEEIEGTNISLKSHRPPLLLRSESERVAIDQVSRSAFLPKRHQFWILLTSMLIGWRWSSYVT
jgi:hypothetical protein